ncbi:hypothetical protein P7C73_g3092, partial [Tremellales sp. Uapishka_1]
MPTVSPHPSKSFPPQSPDLIDLETPTYYPSLIDSGELGERDLRPEADEFIPPNPYGFEPYPPEYEFEYDYDFDPFSLENQKNDYGLLEDLSQYRYYRHSPASIPNNWGTDGFPPSPESPPVPDLCNSLESFHDYPFPIDPQEPAPVPYAPEPRIFQPTPRRYALPQGYRPPASQPQLFPSFEPEQVDDPVFQDEPIVLSTIDELREIFHLGKERPVTPQPGVLDMAESVPVTRTPGIPRQYARRGRGGTPSPTGRKLDDSVPATARTPGMPTQYGRRGRGSPSSAGRTVVPASRTVAPASRAVVPASQTENVIWASMYLLDLDPKPVPPFTSPYTQLLSLPSPRLSCPSYLWNPIPPDALQSSIIGAWRSTEMSPAKKAYIKRFLGVMTDVMNDYFDWEWHKGQRPDKRYEVDVFGSVSWGGESGESGDLDLVVIDRDLPQGYHPTLWRVPPEGQAPESFPTSRPSTPRGRVAPPNESLPPIYNIVRVAGALRDAGMQGVQSVSAASVPIVKFTDASRKLVCDINVNDLGGWYNSSLILHYCLISPYLLRPLIHALKLWANAQDINDPSGSHGPATMSSYCLTLMAIAYLQHRGCLPNLQVNVPANASITDPNIIWVGWTKDQGVAINVGFMKSPPEGWTSRDPDLTAAAALRGFFDYFSVPFTTAARRFDYNAQIVSVLQGGVQKRAWGYMEETKREEMVKAQMRKDGYDNQTFIHAVRESTQKRREVEKDMGKGDGEIQPRNWGQHKIVVQDPFLWEKNCAGHMAKRGIERWQAAINQAHHLLTTKGARAELQSILVNPNPQVRVANDRGPRASSNGSNRGRGRGSARTPVGLMR